MNQLVAVTVVLALVAGLRLAAPKRPAGAVFHARLGGLRRNGGVAR